MNVYLIGYRGTGKTTVARLLAARIGGAAVDADERLEARAGRSIREIFETGGEREFRELEADVLRELSEHDRQIVALGGGVVLREDNRRALKNGRTVWLQASAATLWERVASDPSTDTRRPNLTTQGGPAEIEQLLAAREPLYAQCADWVVDTERRTPAEVAERIEAWLAKEGGPWTFG